MAMVQHIDLFAGEDREIALAGRDEFGLPVDLTGKTVEWRIGRSPLRPEDSSTVVKTATVIDAGMGVFTVQVMAADTTDMDGDFEHMAFAITPSDSLGGPYRAVICQGRFRVRPVLA